MLAVQANRGSWTARHWHTCLIQFPPSAMPGSLLKVVLVPVTRLGSVGPTGCVHLRLPCRHEKPALWVPLSLSCPACSSPSELESECFSEDLLDTLIRMLPFHNLTPLTLYLTQFLIMPGILSTFP